MIPSSMLAALAVALAAAIPAGAAAQGAPPGGAADPAAAGSDAQRALPAGATMALPPAVPVQTGDRLPPGRAAARGGAFRGPAAVVDASDALDEILDEVAADVARLGPARVAPILVERIRVAANLDPSLAEVVEARLAAALLRGPGAALVRCVECDATRAEVVDAAWVVSRGITRAEQARDLARRYGARSFLRASLSATEEPPWIGLDVELVRAEDGVIAFAESYRFGGDDAMLYRGVDRAQHREERLKELEDRLAGRPTWSFAVLLGAAALEAKGLGSNDGRFAVRGGYGAVRIDERFGEGRRHRISLFGGGFTHENVAGGIFQVGLATRISPENVWSHTVEIGAAGGGFVGGGAGNAPLVTVSLDYRPALRIGFRGSVGYLGSFRLGKAPGPITLQDGTVVLPPDERPTIGGSFVEGGVTFSW